MTEATPAFLRREAARFRRLAREIVDHHAQRELISMADEYETKATLTTCQPNVESASQPTE